MCEHSDCEHSLGPGSHRYTCDTLEQERIEKAGLEMSWLRAGLELRNMMLDAGVTPDEIEKIAEEVFSNIYINGVPLKAVACQHCEGRGWILPVKKSVDKSEKKG